MGEGITRNQPCRCGSGKKYKKCHLEREDGKKIQRWEVDDVFRNKFSSKQCMVPDSFKGQCSSEIIKAHTVSKSLNLKLIARDGHVYSHKLSMAKLDKTNGKIEFDLVGINDASTFYGFCKNHDNALFIPIEDQDFVGNLEQLFLLSYRSLSKEIYNKYAVLNVMNEASSFDSGKSIYEQFKIQNFLGDFIKGTELAIRDQKKILEDYNQSLVKKNYSDDNYIYYCMYLNGIPPVMCSGAIFPHYDFQGTLIQNLNDFNLKLDEIIFNSISIGNDKGAFIIFGRKTQAAIDFINSFKQVIDHSKVSTFLNCMFTNCENIFICPSWWDNLNGDSKLLLLNSMNKNLRDETKPDYLLSINIDGVSLEIENIDTNLS